MKKRNNFLIYLVLFWGLSVPVTAAELEGTVQWDQKVSLSTPVNGVISEVRVQEGDVVEKDAVLIKLDDRVYQANVTKQQAEVTYVTRLFEEAQRELERHQELYDRTLLSDHDLEMAKVQFDAAKDKLAKAKSALVDAEVALQYSAVRAPFKGIVVRRYAEDGQVVVSEQQAVKLLDFAANEQMRAMVSVSATKIRGLKRGKKATVSYAGKRFQAEVQSVGLEPLAGKSKRYPVSILFYNKGYRVPVGVSVKVNM